MSNRLFQGVIHQMKDAIDRVIGVIDENGVITGVMFDTSSETPGLGDKIAEADFINKFIGATDDSGADIIANCTYSSKGAKQAVNKAAAAFAAILCVFHRNGGPRGPFPSYPPW